MNNPLQQKSKLLKYRLYDRVVVTNNTCKHGFDIGEIIDIIRLCVSAGNNPHYCAKSQKNGVWWIEERDVTKSPNITKYMTVKRFKKVAL